MHQREHENYQNNGPIFSLMAAQPSIRGGERALATIIGGR